MSIAQKRTYRSPLRQQQVAATRERILRTCAELVAQRTSLDVSIPQLARAAGVSQPTVYRYFPTKRDLFGALATLQFEHVTAGLDPRRDGPSVGQTGPAAASWVEDLITNVKRGRETLHHFSRRRLTTTCRWW